MTEVIDETVEEEFTPFTDEEDREIAYRAETESATITSSRPAVIVAASATGRRKEAIARVRIAPTPCRIAPSD